MDSKIGGKVALVVAATPEVGFAPAHALAAEGVRVVLTSPAETGLHEAADAISEGGEHAFGMAADLNRIEDAWSRRGRNRCGGGGRHRPLPRIRVGNRSHETTWSLT